MCVDTFRTTKPRVSKVTSHSGYFLFRNGWCVFVIFRPLMLPPLLLSWECLELVVSRNLRDRVFCRHTHTGSEGLIHVDNAMNAQWEEEPRFFFFSLPFPIYLLWPEAPANNSTHGSQYCILQTWPHEASGLLQAKKEILCRRDIASLKDGCQQGPCFLSCPLPTLLGQQLRTPAICWARATILLCHGSLLSA